MCYNYKCNKEVFIMTFNELIEKFYNNPEDCINPCEQFECQYDCENCLYNKLVIFVENLLDK